VAWVDCLWGKSRFDSSDLFVPAKVKRSGGSDVCSPSFNVEERNVLCQGE
jgi:hypothetical protein